MFLPQRGITRSSIENLLSHSTKTLVGEAFCVLEKFCYRKTLWVTRRKALGGVSRFPVKNLFSQCPKNFEEEPFCVLENFWYQKLIWIRSEKGVSRFFVKSLLSHSAVKIRRRSHLFFWKTLVSKKLCLRGEYKVFIREFVVSQYR